MNFRISPEEEALIAAYIERYAKQFEWDASGVLERRERNFWAYERFNEIVANDPRRAIELIFETLERTDNEDALNNLAAGPLEDLIRVHGNCIIDRIEELARIAPRFRYLLGGVFPVGDSAVWRRVERMRDNPV